MPGILRRARRGDDDQRLAGRVRDQVEVEEAVGTAIAIPLDNRLERAVGRLWTPGHYSRRRPVHQPLCSTCSGDQQAALREADNPVSTRASHSGFGQAVNDSLHHAHLAVSA